MTQDKEKQPGFKPQSIKRWKVFVIMAAVCIAVGFAAFQLKPAAAKHATIEGVTTRGMVVTVRSVNPGTYAGNITALGEVVPQKQITIKSQVEGQIVFLSEQLEMGNLVKKGELLVRVEQSGFRLQVAEAKNQLAAANITLLKEEREAKEARTNWQQSGIEGDPASPLVLREPQLTAARAEVEAAQASLLHAQTMLKHTEIRTPFDAIVIRRKANSGETLFETDEIATLYGVENVEMSFHLAADSWALLPDAIEDTQVTLFDTVQSANWQAFVVRKSYHLERKSRMRTLILRVQHPLKSTPQLLPGTFVRAEITGKNIPNLLRIPESAFTKQGLVWFVDTKKQLHKYHLEPLFYGNGVVYLPVPESTETTDKKPLLIAVSPNSSFVDGLVVQPMPDKETQDDS